jgi:hypothetical protein
MDADRCGHCGGAELVAIDDGRYRCAYCNSILKRPPVAKAPGTAVIIKRGAKVLIKAGGHLVLKSSVASLTVEDGAELDVAGTLEVEQPGDPDKRKRRH